MSKQTSRGHFVCEKDNFKKPYTHPKSPGAMSAKRE